MPQEIIYTSAPRGLKLGSKGFCTVASTRDMAKPLAERLESLSGYRHLYSPGDERNPVTYSHVVLTIAGKKYNVLSRIGDAGYDYSNRSNKIAHHIALTSQEIVSAGSAWLLSQQDLMATEWSGPSRFFEETRILPDESLAPRVCEKWQQLTGDAGWAGVLAETVWNSRQSEVYLVYGEGTDVLGLIMESQALLPGKSRWLATFTTNFTRLPPNVECCWRCVLAGSDEATRVQRMRHVTVIDVSKPLPEAPASSAAEAARRGETIGGQEKETRVCSSNVEINGNEIGDSKLPARYQFESAPPPRETGFGLAQPAGPPPRRRPIPSARHRDVRDERHPRTLRIAGLSVVVVLLVLAVAAAYYAGSKRAVPEQVARKRVAGDSAKTAPKAPVSADNGQASATTDSQVADADVSEEESSDPSSTDRSKSQPDSSVPEEPAPQEARKDRDGSERQGSPHESGEHDGGIEEVKPSTDHGVNAPKDTAGEAPSITGGKNSLPSESAPTEAQKAGESVPSDAEKSRDEVEMEISESVSLFKWLKTTTITSEVVTDMRLLHPDFDLLRDQEASSWVIRRKGKETGEQFYVKDGELLFSNATGDRELVGSLSKGALFLERKDGVPRLVLFGGRSPHEASLHLPSMTSDDNIWVRGSVYPSECLYIQEVSCTGVAGQAAEQGRLGKPKKRVAIQVLPGDHYPLEIGITCNPGGSGRDASVSAAFYSKEMKIDEQGRSRLYAMGPKVTEQLKDCRHKLVKLESELASTPDAVARTHIQKRLSNAKADKVLLEKKNEELMKIDRFNKALRGRQRIEIKVKLCHLYQGVEVPVTDDELRK